MVTRVEELGVMAMAQVVGRATARVELRGCRLSASDRGGGCWPRRAGLGFRGEEGARHGSRLLVPMEVCGCWSWLRVLLGERHDG